MPGSRDANKAKSKLNVIKMMLFWWLGRVYCNHLLIRHPRLDVYEGEKRVTSNYLATKIVIIYLLNYGRRNGVTDT
jgi:hypothetical protein